MSSDGGPPRDRPADASATFRWTLRACLVASGAAALIDEVLWLRYLGLAMGNTAYALATVLTAFLGGLAAGAWAGGKWTIVRRASARDYAILEFAIAASALAVPLLISAWSPMFGVAYRTLYDHFVAYNLIQFLLCALTIALPTFLMGATLPVVTALLAHDGGDIGREAGLLYAMNSGGGVLGAAAAGFVLLPVQGATATGLFAAGLNVVAGMLAAFVARSNSTATRRVPPPVAAVSSSRAARRREEGATTAGAGNGWETPPRGRVVLLYGLSGFAALALEVGWSRLVGLSIGSTTYGFTITLATYIAGLAVGSFTAPRLSVVTRDPVRALFSAHAAIAIWIVVSLPWLGELPARILAILGPQAQAFATLLAGEAILVQLTIAIPTIAMGAMFPLVAQLLHREGSPSGESTGSAYASNTIGNIAGSWVAGFVLLPWIGMQGTILLSAVVYACAGLLLVLPRAGFAIAARQGAAALFALSVAVVAFCTPSWNRELTSSAPYLATPDIVALAPERRADALRSNGGDLVEYHEGASGVVTVRSRQGALGLYQDGMKESGTGSHSIRLLGHLAMLFHGPARSALVIGLGGGQTLRGLLLHPVESVDSVETSAEVVDVSQRLFAGDVLADPRSRLILGDGRNHLRHSGRRYDVIVSQPSYPWVSGASNLFTREYFGEMRDHLQPAGVAASWFFTRSKLASRSILRAWAEVFPEAYLLNAMGGPRVLIGFATTGNFTPGLLNAAFADPGIAQDLRSFAITQPTDVLRLVVARGDGLAPLAESTPSSTDNNGLVAFHALRMDEE